jgi:hypothetical protein
MSDMSQRLHWTIEQQCPILSITIGTQGDSSTCSFVVDHSQNPTAQQIANANAVLAPGGFDWSQAAQDAWVAAQAEASNPTWQTIKDQAQGAVNTNNTFLALTTPTNAQVLAQVQALTRQNTQIINRLLQLEPWLVGA